MVAALKNSPCPSISVLGPGVDRLSVARLPQATFDAEANRTTCSRKTKAPLQVGRLPVSMSFGVFDGCVPFNRGDRTLMPMQYARSRRPDVVRGAAAGHDPVRRGRRERRPRVCQPARAWGRRQPGRTTAMHICCPLALFRAHGATGKYFITRATHFISRSLQQAIAFARVRQNGSTAQGAWFVSSLAPSTCHSKPYAMFKPPESTLNALRVTTAHPN